jgi:pyruvate formate-lyase activating enzyme-like uncharacterized protein
MSSIYGKFHRKELDAVYSLLWAYSRFQRMERNTEEKKKKKVLRAGQVFLRWTHGLIRSLSGTEGSHPSLLWFSNEEAEAATQARNRLLNALSGGARLGAKGSKPYSNSLSPGCEICQSGDWDCNLINRMCTRDCYFCKRHHSVKTDLDSETEGYTFTTPSAHVDFIKTFGIKGVGFSGGEPLLVKERLLSHIEAIRKEFGHSIYLWVYTNGDLVDREILMKLRDAGLDEIRFNLSAREYDLTPVITAKKYIPTITVEIPAIPEDIELVKSLMVEMQSVGIDFLNLHQLSFKSQNWRELLRHHYHIDCSTGMGIHESEIGALMLLLYACEQQLRLPVNYCSCVYKSRFQKRGQRIRRARAFFENFQEITNAGFIRSLRVSDSPAKIGDLIRRMTNDACQPSLWNLNQTKTSVVLHRSLMPYVDWSSSKLTILYLDPDITLKKKADGFKEGNLEPSQRVTKSVTGLGQESFECWRRLYIDKQNPKQGENMLRELAAFEELESGLPDVS